ncbi:hypothetical protein MHYP_G00054680 [Metynnis hypsauchen]
MMHVRIFRYSLCGLKRTSYRLLSASGSLAYLSVAPPQHRSCAESPRSRLKPPPDGAPRGDRADLGAESLYSRAKEGGKTASPGSLLITDARLAVIVLLAGSLSSRAVRDALARLRVSERAPRHQRDLPAEASRPRV